MRNHWCKGSEVWHRRRVPNSATEWRSLFNCSKTWRIHRPSSADSDTVREFALEGYSWSPAANIGVGSGSVGGKRWALRGDSEYWWWFFRRAASSGQRRGTEMGLVRVPALRQPTSPPLPSSSPRRSCAIAIALHRCSCPSNLLILRHRGSPPGSSSHPAVSRHLGLLASDRPLSTQRASRSEFWRYLARPSSRSGCYCSARAAEAQIEVGLGVLELLQCFAGGGRALLPEFEVSWG